MTRFHKSPSSFVSQLRLKVQDIERAIDFYMGIMGFEILEEKDAEVVLTVDGATPLLTLLQPKDSVEKIPRRTGLYHFAILLPSRIELGLFLKHIKESNYPIIGGSNHGVSEAIYLQDIDDNGIEVYADIDSSLWQVKDKTIEMISEPLDYKSLLDEVRDNKWAGLPKETIIGHIHLHVDDLDRAKKFYVQGLGFEVVMEMSSSALFLSTGGYHHHIGLNIWNGKGAAPLPENAAGMESYTVTFPSSDKREDIIRNLKRLEYQFEKEEGEVLINDPSNNLIRLAI